MDGIYIAALGVFSFMTLNWIISIPLKNTSIVDNIYSLNFIIIAMAYYYTTQQPSLSQSTILACTTIWAIRLSAHLFIKNFGKGEDHRYARFREMYGAERFWWFSYFQVFLLQSLFVWVFATPIHLSAYTAKPFLPTPYYIGLGLFAFGLLYESIADYQLYQFKKTATPDQLMMKGLWQYSRHPNHFGEIILWTGIATICIASTHTIGILAYISPIAITLTFIYLSGAVQQEPRMSKNKRNFSQYVTNTPNIIPKLF
ncbi:DUF1295 domain-containing protein [Gammaproteobacteria bacterium]|nr:DUF1295 domain-containing protein [Gammaproteobacteria bacterium]